MAFRLCESSVPAFRPIRRRRISPEAGSALEKLGHAIEYLADEYIHKGSSSFSANDAQLKAIEMLMARNREVYFACPVVPSLGERLRKFLNAPLGYLPVK